MLGHNDRVRIAMYDIPNDGKDFTLELPRYYQILEVREIGGVRKFIVIEPVDSGTKTAYFWFDREGEPFHTASTGTDFICSMVLEDGPVLLFGTRVDLRTGCACHI